MYWNNQSENQLDFVREVEELEDSYAEALADGIDARSLSVIWQRIKMLKQEIEESKRPGPTDERAGERVRSLSAQIDAPILLPPIVKIGLIF
jgi:hypothetical protein